MQSDCLFVTRHDFSIVSGCFLYIMLEECGALGDSQTSPEKVIDSHKDFLFGISSTRGIEYREELLVVAKGVNSPRRHQTKMFVIHRRGPHTLDITI